MIIATTISGLTIGLYKIEDRPGAVEVFFDGRYSPDNRNQNLSHAGGLLALCQHSSGAVGIDLEVSLAPAGYMMVAEEFFWPDEVAYLQLADRRQQANLFLALWTAKEAHCKLFRSNIYDDLPGPDLTAWLKKGCPQYYNYNHVDSRVFLVYNTGSMNGKAFCASVCIRSQKGTRQ